VSINVLFTFTKVVTADCETDLELGSQTRTNGCTRNTTILKAMSVYQYVVTAQKPTAVHFAVKGRFTSSEEINLIIR